MPLYALQCSECGAPGELYCHVGADLGAETRLCACGGALAPVLSVGRGLTWFEEGRARTIWNLGPEPVTVTSHRQHERLMREAGVTWATPWHVQKTKGWV